MNITNIFRTKKPVVQTSVAVPEPSIQQVWFEEAMKVLKERVGSGRLKKPCHVSIVELDYSVYKLLFVNGLHNFNPIIMGNIADILKFSGFFEQAFYNLSHADHSSSRKNFKEETARLLRIDETVFDLILNDTKVLNKDVPVITKDGDRAYTPVRISAYEAIFKKQDVTLQDVFDLWQRFIDMPVQEASMSVMQDISDFLADIDYSKYLRDGVTLA